MDLKYLNLTKLNLCFFIVLKWFFLSRKIFAAEMHISPVANSRVIFLGPSFYTRTYSLDYIHSTYINIWQFLLLLLFCLADHPMDWTSYHSLDDIYDYYSYLGTVGKLGD